MRPPSTSPWSCMGIIVAGMHILTTPRECEVYAVSTSYQTRLFQIYPNQINCQSSCLENKSQVVGIAHTHSCRHSVLNTILGILGGVGNAVGGVTDTVGKTASGVTDTVGNTAGGLGKGVSDTVGGATKGLGDTTKGRSFHTVITIFVLMSDHRTR